MTNFGKGESVEINGVSGVVEYPEVIPEPWDNSGIDYVAVKLNGDPCYTFHDTATVKKNSNRQIGDRPKKVMTIRIDADLRELLKAKASAESVTQNQVLESALKQYLGL